MHVSVQRRHVGDGTWGDHVLLAPVRVFVHDRNLGGDPYLASHHPGMQTNSLLYDSAEVWEVVHLRNGWNLPSDEAGLRKLFLKLLRLGWLSEEVVERAGERVCYGLSSCQPNPLPYRAGTSR